MSAGILGHVWIATSSSNILHIKGKGYNSEDISLKDWHANYANKYSNSRTRVYRNSSSSIASATINWVIRTYRNSNSEYKITANLASTSIKYCSKMVWQGYYYGPSSHNTNDPTVGYRLPYDLPTIIHNLSYQHEH